MKKGDMQGKIDLNVATAHELMMIEGISEQLAGNIVEYRHAQGRFRDINELTTLGMSEQMIDQVSQHIYIRKEGHA